MNSKKLFRQVHYWLSLAILVPAGIMFLAGIFLMLKKDIDWIQPQTEQGIAQAQIPAVSFEAMLEAAKQHPEAEIDGWSDIDRVDLRVDDGVAKLRAKSGWEVQVDTQTAQVLSVAYRRSDIIESIHDGSFFAAWVKYSVFLPAGVLLVVMWGTGIYLFLIPRLAKRRKARQA